MSDGRMLPGLARSSLAVSNPNRLKSELEALVSPEYVERALQSGESTTSRKVSQDESEGSSKRASVGEGVWISAPLRVGGSSWLACPGSPQSKSKMEQALTDTHSAKELHFSDELVEHDTFSTVEYDRSAEKMPDMTKEEMLQVRREMINYQRFEMEVHPDSPRLSRGLPTLQDEKNKKRRETAENAAVFARF